MSSCLCGYDLPACGSLLTGVPKSLPVVWGEQGVHISLPDTHGAYLKRGFRGGPQLSPSLLIECVYELSRARVGAEQLFLGEG